MSRFARARGDRPREAGETLIELLVTMMIMGIAGLAIAGGLTVALSAAVSARQQGEVERYLHAWAETVGNPTDVTYYSCSNAYCYESLAPSPPSGISGSVSGIDCWTGSAFAACGSDLGIRRVRLQVSATVGGFPGFTRSLEVVVRRPCSGTTC